jgi:1,4-dihydroxy-2-naphthoate octaprenyltransferase
MAPSLFKLFRWKPVAAWGAVGILIATSCAVHSGLPVDWLNLLIAAGIILIIQGIIAHGINDLADEAVDRIAPIEETGRSKVLVSGEMSRRSLIAITSAAVLAVFLIIILLAMRAGPVVFLFAAFAAFAVFGYSCKPLKLGWKPFSELTVVVPVITALVCGVEYVLIGTVTLTAIYIGISYGFFNASWFMYSRAQDHWADTVMGKKTTIVRYGLTSTQEFAVMNIFISGLFALFASVVTGWITGLMIMVAYIGPALDYMREMRDEEDRLRPTFVPSVGMTCHSVKMSDSPISGLPPEICAKLRVRGMILAATYGMYASIGIFIGSII